jgi:hypothetical protein
MNTFSWSKALGFGVLIWGIMAVALWILASIQSLSPFWAHGLAGAVGGIIALLFTRSANPESGSQAFGYGLTWAVIVLLGDLVVTQWFDAHIFSAWQYWIGAGIVFLAPWVETEAKQAMHHSV